MYLTGIVPDKFKLAGVIPVFKMGSQTNVSIIIGLFLLYQHKFDKLLEKLTFNPLVDFLDKRHLTYNDQFGFCSHHSADHAVLSIIDQVQKAIEDHDLTLVEYCWTSAKHLILFTMITFCSRSFNTSIMVSQALLKTALTHI